MNCINKQIIKNIKLYILLQLIILNYLIYFIKIKLNYKILKTNYRKHISYKNNYKKRVCICTLGRSENKYIREYINHYEKYGVDKIFLYDNNEINGERFEEVIKDYINNGFVDILNWRGISKCHHKVMNDCYIRNNKQYDWLIFYDLDEFIHLYNYSNIKEFLNEKKFNKCQIIY